MSPELRILKRVRRRLIPRGSWTRGTNARDAQGDPIHYAGQRATCWCLVGAVLLESGTTGNEYPATTCFSEIAQTLKRDVQDDINAVWAFNDSATHKEVLAVLDDTITRLETQHG
jgi:hypothetical protein